MTLALSPTAQHDASVTLAVSRLAEEFDGWAEPQEVVSVVQTARRELSGAPVGALPELVERLARYRLHVSIG
ncbi:MAG: uncharacterized protein JWP46_4407 [Modestobacter sp.]|nr:uncharacterized protein [Modestobacter sp.]MCW2676562.1 uncharacterized protein [Modestobacter sp.]